MKDILLTRLRDRNATLEQFRDAAEKLGLLLAIEAAAQLPKKSVTVETPLASTKGEKLSSQVVLVPILRSGLIFLPSFLHYYPNALVGFIGIRREEVTAIPHLYYSKLPPFTKDYRIVVLDPMLATAGSANLAIQVLKESGAAEEQIILASAIAAPEGIKRLKEEVPGVKIVALQIDEKLNAQKFIFPGLGDFGDRYFGTS